MAIIVEALGLISSVTGIHSWITSSKDKRELCAKFEKTDSGINVLSSRMATIGRQIDSMASEIWRLSSSMESVIGLACPNTLDAAKVDEYIRTLSKYIATDIVPLDAGSAVRSGRYRIQPGSAPMIWTRPDGQPVIGLVPSGFLKDYFGIEVLFSGTDRTATIRGQGQKAVESLQFSTPQQSLRDYSYTVRPQRFSFRSPSTVHVSFSHDEAPVSSTDPWRTYRWTGKSHIFRKK